MSVLGTRITSLPMAAMARRRVLGMSLREMGEQTGVSYTVLHRIERREDYDARMSTLIALADWLEETNDLPRKPG